MKYRIAFAGSSTHSQMIAATLAADERFEIPFSLCPAPAKVGRHQELRQSPLQVWSEEQGIPVFSVTEKIQRQEYFDFTQDKEAIDFLFVVDFGFYIPAWLLELPKIAPVNLHPSLLPAWRGSSPGQFALLFRDFQGLQQGKILGGRQSGITLMVMSQSFDQGPIIFQLPFLIQDNWQQTEYYQFAFSLIAPQLPDLLANFAQGNLQALSQPLQSPTPTARRLSKEDSFVDWQMLKQLLETPKDAVPKQTDLKDYNLQNLDFFQEKGLLMRLLLNEEFCHSPFDQSLFLHSALAAFQPWPGVWTIIKTTKGELRMKILSTKVGPKLLNLDQVQIEGKNPGRFSDFQNLLVS